MMKNSKADIDRLGNRIREQKSVISEQTLDDLQAYRISHKDVLSQVFSMLCHKTKRIHASAIVTYRIKRFESIISKLQRYPEMRFSRMWDIGGCRCILRSNAEVYKLRDLILNDNDNFEVVKEYDYIKNPQKDGYKSLHLFIKGKSVDKVIEVQLRNQVDHNWATLVEISDVLFESRLKELGDNKELLRFHYLLSDVESLKIEEKKEIFGYLKKYDYLGKLSEVFSRNYIKVRRQWFDIESQNNHRYFFIETSKNDVPKIESFKHANDAEAYYFNVYKSRQNANIVLTHLQMPSYQQISIAYSNYILTFHSFMTECYEILESLISESLEKGYYLEYFRLYNFYNGLVFTQISNLFAEIREVQSFSAKGKNRKHGSKRKEKEWVSDIQKQIFRNNETRKKIAKKFAKCMPKGKVGQYIVKYLSRRIEGKYQKKIQILLDTMVKV